MLIQAHAVISPFQKIFHDFFLDVTSGKMKKVTFSIFSDFQILPRSLSRNVFKRASRAADTENSKFCVFLVQDIAAENVFFVLSHETCSSTSRQKMTNFYIKKQWFISSECVKKKDECARKREKK